MSGAGDNAAADELGEDRAIGGVVLAGPRQTVVGAVERDRRCFDLRPCSQPALGRLETRIAFRVQVAMTIRVDDAIDEVGIVE